MRAVVSGLERLLAEIDAGSDPFEGRSYALLAHGASVAGGGTGGREPAHLALHRRGRGPACLLGPEHGYYGVEQDMVAAESQRDPWTGVPIHSLYGDGEDTLRPAPEVFRGVDLLVIDLQDVGRAAEAAVRSGAEVWVLDRPNPLGGWVEGPRRKPGFESFVGAFEHPVTHGLTLGELMLLEGSAAGFREAVRVWRLQHWDRRTPAAAWEGPWIAPSPNMPRLATARIYPGLCLLEATSLSEGRGTTRPFHLVGAPGLDPTVVAETLGALEIPGLAFLPTYFRPQFQKHAGEVCGGVEIVLAEAVELAPFRAGVEILAALVALDPTRCAWRAEPYEFVLDRPAVDLLTGDESFRRAVEAGRREDLDAWISGWPTDEQAFCRRAEPHLLYPGPLRPRSTAGAER